MVSDRTRNEVWQHVYDVERLCRYYEAMRDKMHRNIVIAQVVAALAAVGAIIMVPMSAVAMIGCFVAVFVAFSMSVGYAGKSASARITYEQLTGLRIDIRNLWLLVDDESSDEADIRLIVDELARKVEETTLRADLSVDKRLNKRTSAEAKQILEGRYDIKSKKESD